MFKTDADESTAASAADAAMLMDNELDGAPGGIVGFSLNWALQSCT